MFEDAEDQKLYENIVDGLRSQGWDRFNAEDEAYNRVHRMIVRRNYAAKISADRKN